MQFAESSIAQLEKTRSSQQHQIKSLQIQVQGLETTVETLGHFMLQMIEKNPNIDCPDDVRRIIQQISTLDSQRKKPIFIERKIGKSMSVNGNLGFPLKVLEELNENVDKENGTSPRKTKSAFFENTYQQLRKQNSRNRLNHIDDENKSITSNASNGSNKSNKLTLNKYDDIDSGIATPITPKDANNLITNIVEINLLNHTNNINSPATTNEQLIHPFGNCEDVNFKFNGTTQLKTIRPIHLRTTITQNNCTDKHIDGRS